MQRQIIDEYREPTLGERFGTAFGNVARGLSEGIPNLLQGKQRQQEEMALGKSLGLDNIGNLDPQLRSALLQQAQRGQQAENIERMRDMSRQEIEKLRASHKQEIEEIKGEKGEQENKENIVNLQGALQRLDRMRDIRAKGNLGFGSTAFSYFGGKTAKDKGEYEQLGKSLIQYASTIPIRNRLEFETLAGELINANLTDAESEGVLNAMERILNDSLFKAGGSPIETLKEVKLEPARERKKSGFKDKNTGEKVSLTEIFG